LLCKSVNSDWKKFTPCAKNSTKQVNTICSQNAEGFNFDAAGRLQVHCILSVNTFVTATDKRIHIPKTQTTVEASP